MKATRPFKFVAIALLASMLSLFLVLLLRRGPSRLNEQATIALSEGSRKFDDGANRQAPASARTPPRFTQSSQSRISAYDAYRHHRDNSKGAVDYHAEERRDPVWAPKMEQVLQTRLSAGAAYGFKGFKADEIECRTSSCRLDVSWGPEDLDVLEKLRGGGRHDPLTWITLHEGLLGSVENRARLKPSDLAVPSGWRVRRDLDGRYRTTHVVMFDENGRDTESYFDRLARIRANRQSFVDKVVDRDSRR